MANQLKEKQKKLKKLKTELLKSRFILLDTQQIMINFLYQLR